MALQAAALDPRIATVVAVATFSDLRTVATERAPFFASRRNVAESFRLAESDARTSVSTTSARSRSQGDIRVPVLVIHGQDDRETPPTHSQRVFAALRAPKRLILVPGAGHNDVLRAGVWNDIDSWIDGVVASRADAPSQSR